VSFREEIQKSKILITGASGWIGQELLCVLQDSYGKLSDLDLTCAASSSKTISIHGEEIKCISLSDLKESNVFDLIIHLAFVLPNTSFVDDRERYVAINQGILEVTKTIFENNSKALKLVFSSGAASDIATPNDSVLMKSYGTLKKEMEVELYGLDTLIVRLWSATGHHLPRDSHYALGDIIRMAESDETIVIKNNVQRSYIQIQEFLQSALQFLYAGGKGIVNSGGYAVTLSELARTVVRVLNSKSDIRVEAAVDSSNLDYVSPKCELPELYQNGFSDLSLQMEKMLKRD
jgi:nucleoside-diphosphate-sugar epimerase